MNLDELHEMWEKDGPILTGNISNESAQTPKLHNKYYRMYVTEGLKLKKLKADYSKLKKLKIEYYKGQLDLEELKAHGWEMQPLKILNTDIPMYIEADDDIINLSLRIGVREAIVDYLESIIRQINSRGWQIRNIIEWERFTNGG